jgi:D-tyrosyl-tRNA(Tyr) deacylase
VRVVLQRVSRARVTVGERVAGSIDRGLLALVGVEAGDGPEDVTFIAGKIRELRIFPDETGRMNAPVAAAGGSVLVVSQFTLLGDCRKGRRPSFDRAATPDDARALYDALVQRLRADGLEVSTGEFQAMMQVELVNDGPVTLILDSRR